MKEKDVYKRKGRKYKNKIERSVEKLKIENLKMRRIFLNTHFFIIKVFVKK